MRVTATQNIKKYSLKATQNLKISRVIITPRVKREMVITISPLGKRGFTGPAGGSFSDNELVVSEDGQTVFNIFQEPNASNLYINDCIYFKDKSYQIQNTLSGWKLIWLNAFQLSKTDLLIFRKL